MPNGSTARRPRCPARHPGHSFLGHDSSPLSPRWVLADGPSTDLAGKLERPMGGRAVPRTRLFLAVRRDETKWSRPQQSSHRLRQATGTFTTSSAAISRAQASMASHSRKSPAGGSASTRASGEPGAPASTSGIVRVSRPHRRRDGREDGSRPAPRDLCGPRSPVPPRGPGRAPAVGLLCHLRRAQ